MTRKPSLTAKVKRAAKRIAKPSTSFWARCRDYAVTLLCAGGFIATKRDGHWEIGDATVLLAIVGGCIALANSTPAKAIQNEQKPPEESNP